MDKKRNKINTKIIKCLLWCRNGLYKKRWIWNCEWVMWWWWHASDYDHIKQWLVPNDIKNNQKLYAIIWLIENVVVVDMCKEQITYFSTWTMNMIIIKCIPPSKILFFYQIENYLHRYRIFGFYSADIFLWLNNFVFVFFFHYSLDKKYRMDEKKKRLRMNKIVNTYNNEGAHLFLCHCLHLLEHLTFFFFAWWRRQRIWQTTATTRAHTNIEK